MQNASSQTTLVGAALIALGVLFLLPVVTGIELSISKWWPLIILVGGVFALTRGAPWQGLTAIGVAVLLLLANLDIVDTNIWQFWPVLLLVAGAAILFGHAGRSRPQEGSGFTSATSDDLNVASFFSGSEQRIDSQAFRGGRVTAMFGGADIDLRGAAIADGAATIDVSAVFRRRRDSRARRLGRQRPGIRDLWRRRDQALRTRRPQSQPHHHRLLPLWRHRDQVLNHGSNAP